MVLPPNQPYTTGPRLPASGEAPEACSINLISSIYYYHLLSIIIITFIIIIIITIIHVIYVCLFMQACSSASSV
jgi:hypothetical protein